MGCAAFPSGRAARARYEKKRSVAKIMAFCTRKSMIFEKSERYVLLDTDRASPGGQPSNSHNVSSFRSCCSQTQPFIHDLAHVFGLAISDPRHEWSVEPERRPALSGHEAPHVLRISVAVVHRGITCNRIGVPVECHALPYPTVLKVCAL